MVQLESEELLRVKSVTEVVMAFHRHECGAPGSSKGLGPGDGHPLIPKEGHDSRIPLFSRLSPVFTMCMHGATKVLS